MPEIILQSHMSHEFPQGEVFLGLNVQNSGQDQAEMSYQIGSAPPTRALVRPGELYRISVGGQLLVVSNHSHERLICRW